MCDFSTSLFKLHKIKLRRSRRYLTRRIKRINFCFIKKKKNLFPVQIILSQDSRYVAVSLPRMKVLFPLDLGSSFAAYRVSLSIALLWRLSFSPWSLFLFFATLQPHISWGFPILLSNHPSYLVIPFARSPLCARPHSSSMLLNFPLIILLLLKFRHSDEKQSKLQYRNTGDAVNYVSYVNKFNEFVIIYLQL